MTEIVTVPAGTQLDGKHVALSDMCFVVERRAGRYAVWWEDQDRFGMTSEALSVGDAMWSAKKEVCRLFDWVRDGGGDAQYAERWIGTQLRHCIGCQSGTLSEGRVDSAVLEGHLLEAGDGYEWSSLFISGMDLAEALAAALRVDKLERSYIQLWGHDDEGESVDPDSTIVTVADDERPYSHERLFYDFGRVRITVERVEEADR